MDGEGLGRKLLLTPLATPENPSKAECGHFDSISKEKLNAGTAKKSLQREGAWAEELILGGVNSDLSPKTAASIFCVVSCENQQFFCEHLRLFGAQTF